MDKFTNNNQECAENVIAGIVGALLFSLAGAVVYFILYMMGYIASISGLIGVVCAVKGYTLFSSKESKKGIVIATVIALLMIVLSSYLCLAYEIYDVYKTGFEAGEMDFSLTFPESVRAVPFFLEEPDIRGSYISDLLFSLFFCLIGCGSFVMNKFKNANTKKDTAAPCTEATEDASEPAETKADENKAETTEELPEEESSTDSAES